MGTANLEVSDLILWRCGKIIRYEFGSKVQKNNVYPNIFYVVYDFPQ